MVIGHKTRNLEPLGGRHIRQVRQTQKLVPNIYKSDLSNFVVKRNFDEIDQTSLPLSKRFFSGPSYPYRYQNSVEMPIEMSWRSGYDKKRLSPLADYPMDEIDVSNFPIGSKRSLGNNVNSIERFYSGLGARGRRGGDWPMDEIDASYFPVGSRRSVSR
ncbi:hypothetical protein O0L34_g6042 [Tuta absoluta]|nr:hypothetical protein O0L34_g6042 [Tuta absoluta]